jgi:hypothetical protein
VGDFVIQPGTTPDAFILRPAAVDISKDQLELSHEVDDVRQTLMLLKEQGVFKKGNAADMAVYDGFILRIRRAAEIGCVEPQVQTSFAAAELERIRTDIMRRKGRLMGTLGAFVIEEGGPKDAFNLRPAPCVTQIPEDQRKLSHEIYEVRHTLKLLKEKGAFKQGDPPDPVYQEFITRIRQAAQVGCTDPQVHTALAVEALKQIRADIVRRKGRLIIYRYLLVLAGWALAGIVIGAAFSGVAFILAALDSEPALSGYGWVIIGSMAGAWISVAAGRREISFDDIQHYVDFRWEPLIRMLFVGLLASTFALLLELKVFAFSIGEVDFAEFDEHVGRALVLGLFAGIGERALSLKLIERARETL